jgi:hypothetical protein
MIPIHLAVEDTLSEQVARRLLAESNRGFHVTSVISRGGNGYLKTKIAALNRSAQALPFFVLTDLDTGICASALIKEWLPSTQNRNLIFRVAVREVEAWLLGDRDGMAQFLGISTDITPARPEALPDPKRTLLQLAAKARKAEVRHRLLPRRNSSAIQGPDYNGCLAEYVASHWNPSTASLLCPSLERCRQRIQSFQPA